MTAELRKVGGIDGSNAGQLKQGYRGIILILARITRFLETEIVPMALELLANLFPGHGSSAGSDQPPAFVAAEVAR